MLPKIVVTQPLHTEVLQALQAQAQVVMNAGPEPWPTQTLHAHLAEASGLMAFMTDRVDRDTLRHAPRLRSIACALKGYDNFDLTACAEAGVSVSFVPDLLTEPTAELALGLAIAAGRHLIAGDRRVRLGHTGWRPELYGTGLHGATAAVVGLGRVGQAIVDRLAGFGCRAVLGVDPSARDARTQAASLPQALAQADFLFLAVPLVSGTRHLINAPALAQAKPGQIIVNVGRGSVVHEDAVADALQSGLLGAYAADVFEMEDWALHDRPREVPEALRHHPRTVLTPHLGSAVRAVRLAIEKRAAANLIGALRGERLQDLACSAQDA